MFFYFKKKIAYGQDAIVSISIWSYGVVVSISGCDPLDPGSTPGTARTFFLKLGWLSW